MAHKTISGIAGLAIQEVNLASSKFAPFNSPREGFAVIKEELDELWDLVKDKNATIPRLEEEAIQVAAMAIRFVYDCCND